ncbi:MAG: hypothetical protein ALECFALPRED_003687 [Alectoria fallacina]|uniref:Uncharacterized protein n=1 Tax=Alectoria fallacina TaxID=1903189 RepID=A0A8H3FMI2_9LECA|nr:MAG: hypothetical protein ALECFALPRED_003687 [Alectoria fallacina]
MGQKLDQLASPIEVPITSEMTSANSPAREDMPTNLESWEKNYMRLTEVWKSCLMDDGNLPHENHPRLQACHP